MLYSVGQTVGSEDLGGKQMCVLIWYKPTPVRAKAATAGRTKTSSSGGFLNNVAVRSLWGGVSRAGGSAATKGLGIGAGAAVNGGIGVADANIQHEQTSEAIDAKLKDHDKAAVTSTDSSASAGEIEMVPNVMFPPSPMQVEIGKQYTVGGKLCTAELRPMKGNKLQLNN
jgi:hypothetical protein